MKIKSILLALLFLPFLVMGQAQSSDLDPVTHKIYVANAHAHKGRYPQALEALNQALALDQSSAHAYKVRGHVYVAMGDLKKAIADLSRVIDLVPDSANAYVDRSIVNFKLGLKSQAKQDIERALQLAPKSVFALAVRNQILES